MTAILGWADSHGIARTQCIIDPGNARSIGLATALGYRPLGPRRFAVEAGDAKTVEVFERAGGSAS